MRLAAASWTGPIVATALMLVLGRLAWRDARGHEATLRWLATTPRASISAPVKGPAIYAGVLRGPADRKTPLGTRASAYWWWVDVRQNKTWKNVCSSAIRGELELAD